MDKYQCLNALPYRFFRQIFEVKMSNFYLMFKFFKLEKYNKTKLVLNSSQNFEAMV